MQPQQSHSVQHCYTPSSKYYQNPKFYIQLHLPILLLKLRINNDPLIILVINDYNVSGINGLIQKKNSEINIHYQAPTLSPLRRNNTSPLSRTPTRANLSPMKRFSPHHPQSKTPRKQFLQETRNIRPPIATADTNFESQLESLASNYRSGWESKARNGGTWGQKRGQNSGCLTMGGNITGERMKESKKLFTRCLAEKNSQKKVQADGFSQQTSLFEENKQNNEANASYKAFRQIQMIESVQPLQDKLTYDTKQSQRRKSDYECIRPHQKNDIKFAPLINGSFSLPPQQIESAYQPPVVDLPQLGANAPVHQSISIASSYGDFSLLLRLAGVGEGAKVRKSEEHEVLVSLEGEREGLTMQPFM